VTSHGSLNGKRILVVEDEYFVATDLRMVLQDAGAEVVGPVGNLAQGLSLLDENAADAAILDVNLAGARSFPLAESLAERAIPYMFVTGYDSWALPERYRHVPRISKPFGGPQILGGLSRLLTQESET